MVLLVAADGGPSCKSNLACFNLGCINSVAAMRGRSARNNGAELGAVGFRLGRGWRLVSAPISPPRGRWHLRCGFGADDSCFWFGDAKFGDTGGRWRGKHFRGPASW